MNEQPNPVPRLAVVLAVAKNLEAARRTLGYLARQTVVDRLELVLVIVDAQRDADHRATLRTLRLPFASQRLLLLTDRRATKAGANAAGCRAATAPLIAFVEDHCFPEPRWAEALLARFVEPWQAVGPLISNANPSRAASWSDLLLNYAPWLDPQQSGEGDYLPPHNCAYRKAALDRYGDALADHLDVETKLHEAIRHGGGRLYFDPAAKLAHLNVSRRRELLRAHYLGGRHYAAARRRSWPVWRRLVYALGSPLIPLVRLRRLLSSWPGGQSGVPRRRRVFATLVLGTFGDGVGQGLGYAFGARDMARKLRAFEFDRWPLLAANDPVAAEYHAHDPHESTVLP